MQYSTETYGDESGSYEQDLGIHDSHSNPLDWAVGSDEAGERIYCEAALSDFLQQDSI